MNTETYILYSEAAEEAERLSRVLKRDHRAVPVGCDCDYDRMCGKCAGEGQYYDVQERPCLALVPFDPDFHSFTWTTVANAAQQDMLNRCAALGRQAAVTLSCVREATKVVRELTRDLEAA